MLCTPIYAAPQILFKKQYTTKSDLYSLGIVLYRMAFGKFPFTADEVSFFKKMKNQEPPEIPLNIDHDIRDLLMVTIVHNESNRIGWSDFYRHPCVIKALSEDSIKLEDIGSPTDDQIDCCIKNNVFIIYFYDIYYMLMTK
ncbi:Protein kinase domain-containing protein [Entamoeba marina]